MQWIISFEGIRLYSEISMYQTLTKTLSVIKLSDSKLNSDKL